LEKNVKEEREAYEKSIKKQDGIKDQTQNVRDQSYDNVAENDNDVYDSSQTFQTPYNDKEQIQISEAYQGQTLKSNNIAIKQNSNKNKTFKINPNSKKQDGGKKQQQINANAAKPTSPQTEKTDEKTIKNVKRVKCLLCEKEHTTNSCETYKTLKACQTRLLQLKVCFKCLSNRHETKNCTRIGACKKCNSPKHNVIVCTKKKQQI
jgi:hypothetical protein